VAVPADRVDAVDAAEQPRPSERERRWADRVEEDESSGAPTPVVDDTEDEGDEAGPPTPPPLQGDAFAHAEGFEVTEASTNAATGIVSSILDGGTDEWL